MPEKIYFADSDPVISEDNKSRRYSLSTAPSKEWRETFSKSWSPPDIGGSGQEIAFECENSCIVCRSEFGFEGDNNPDKDMLTALNQTNTRMSTSQTIT